MATATGFSLTGTGGFVSNLTVTRTFRFGSTAGGSETNAPNLAITSGPAIPSITTNSWFNALNFTGTTATPAAATIFVSTLTLATGGTYTAITPIFTRTQTWTTQFSKQLGGIGFNLAGGTLTLGDSPSLVATGTTTLTNGTLNLGGFDLTTGIFSSTNTNTRSVVFGTNNIVLAHTTAATVVLSMATATGFTCTGAGGFTADAAITRTLTVGSTAGDATNAPNVSVTGTGAAIITITSTSFIKNLSFGSTAFALPATNLNIVGNLTLSSAVGATFTALTATMVGTGSILSNGKTIGTLTIDSVSGTTTLSDALTLVAGNTTTLTSGNLTLNGFTLTTGTFVSNNSNTRSIAFGTGKIILATPTLALANLNIGTATNFTYTSSGTFGSGTGCFQATMSVTRSFFFGTTAGATADNAPRLFLISGASVPTFSTTTTSTFGELDFGTTSFTAAADTVNLVNLYNVSTSVLTGLTANMIGTGSIRSTTSIGPLIINTSGITTTIAGTTLCTTAALTLGTLDFGGQTLTCSSTFTWNGGSLLISGTGTLSCTTFTNNGNTLSLSSGTINPSTSFVLTSGSFTLGGTATFGAVPLFTHTAGDVTFNISYALTATGTYTFTAGTLTLADGVTLTTGIFSSNNANTRSIAFGSTSAGNINLRHTTAATIVLSMATATGFSYTGPGGFTVADMANTRTLTFGTTGGSTTNAPNLTFTTGASVATLTTGSWFKNLTFGTTSFNPGTTALNMAGNLTLSATGTYSTLTFTPQVSATYSFNGTSVGAIAYNFSGITITMASAGGCTILTMTAGTIDFAGFAFTCSGAATYNSTGTLLNFGTFSCTTFTNNGVALSLPSGSINPSVSFVLTSGSFTYNSGTLGATPLFTHTAGDVVFNASYSLTATGTYTFTAGTLTLVNNVILNTGIFASSGAGVRSIAFGSSISSTTGSLYFTGNNYTNTTNSAFSMGTEDFTVEGWAWMDPASDSLAGIICSVTGSDSGFGIARDYGGGMLNANGSGGVSIGWLTPLPTSTWFHFALTMQSNTLRLFKNGVLQGTTTNTYSGTAISNNSNLVSLATRYAGGSSYPFAGYFSNIRIVRGVAVYTAAFTPPALPLSSTQSANTNGSPSAAVTGTQTTLLLNTAYGSAYLTDSSSYNSTTTGSSLPTSNKINPYPANINLTHTTAATTVLSMAIVTNFTYTGTGGFTVADMANTRTLTFGTTGGSTTNAVNLTFTTGASVATLTTGSWFKNLTFGTTAFNPGTTALNMAGNLTLSATGTYSTLTFTPQVSATYSFNGTSIGAIAYNFSGITITMASTGGCTTLTMTAGTIDFAGFAFTCSGAATYNSTGTLLNFGTFSCTTFTNNGVALSLPSGSINPSVSFVLTSGSFTYNTGTLSAVPLFTHTAGDVVFNASYALTATGTYTFTAGTLTLADGATLTTGIFSSSNVNSRSIAFGSTSAGNINLTHTTAATVVLAMTTATGFSYTGPGGFTVADMANTRTFQFGTTGGSTTNAPNLTFTTGASVASLTNNSWFKNLTFGTTSFDPTATNVFIVGNLTLSSSGTYTTLIPNMVGTGTLTSNGRTIPTLIINTTGTATLGSALALIATGQTTLTSGTLDLGGFDLTTGIFNSTNTNTRSIAFGTNNIILVYTTAATINLNMATATGFTWTGTTGGFTADASITRTFQFGTTAGGTAANAPNLAFTLSGASQQTITTGGWFNNLNFGTTTFTSATATLNLDGDLTLSSGGTYTTLTATMVGTGTITSNTKTIAALTINSTSGTTTLGSALALVATGTTTLTSGTLDLGGFDLTTGIFASTGTAARSITFGTNNIVLANTTAGTTVLSFADATGFTWTGTTGGFTATAAITRTFVFGTTGGTATNAPNLSLTLSGTAIATFTTGSWFNTLSFGTTAFAIAATALNLNALTLSIGGTFTALTPTMRGTGTITSNGKTLAAFVVNTTGTATLADALTASGAITLTLGILACSIYAVTSATFASTGTATRSMTGSGTYTITGAGATAFSNASATGITITGMIISMTAATAKTFAGGGGSYSTLNQGGAGALTISGDNSFSDLTATTRPSTITFTASSTQTFAAFTLSGVLGSLVTINSSIAATRATLSKSSGTVSVGYLSIQDSNATGGAGWYAGTTSTNVSNNLGWIFTAPPTPGNVYLGNFFAFF